MPIRRKAQKFLLPAMLIVMSPMAIAQVQSAEPVQKIEQVQQLDTAQLDLKEDVTERRPASWHGKKVALRGRDVVSFGKDSGPVKGSKKFVAEWDDTKWYFANEQNRDAFKTDPKKYIPEFGGYCPVALSKGKAKIGRTNQFTRVDDKLYLNYNRRNQEAFATKPNDYILRAQINW